MELRHQSASDVHRTSGQNSEYGNQNLYECLNLVFLYAHILEHNEPVRLTDSKTDERTC